MNCLTINRNPHPESAEDLKQIEAHLVCRLGGRIRELRVLGNDGGLVIRGWTSTYYAKQLAQEAVMEVARMPISANAIEVR